MRITLKLVEVNGGKFVVMRKDGFGGSWYMCDITKSYDGQIIDFTNTWPLKVKWFKYCAVETEQEAQEGLDKVIEALMAKHEKVKIARTVKVVKVKV